MDKPRVNVDEAVSHEESCNVPVQVPGYQDDFGVDFQGNVPPVPEDEDVNGVTHKHKMGACNVIWGR